MTTRLKWNTSQPLSVLHAARSVAQHVPVVDRQVETLLQSSVAEINGRLSMMELDLRQFWFEMVASGLDDVDDRTRCERVLGQIGCSPLGLDSLAAALAGRLTDMRLAYAEGFPKLADQLPLRGRPLCEMWDAYGSGLLRELGRLTHNRLLPPRVQMVLVQPVRGGDGDAAPAHCGAWIEAVLTHPEPRVPEVLRVAWLVGRLGLGRGEANRLVAAERLPYLAAMALVPIVLSAGSQLELIPDAPLPVQAALAAWHLDCSPATVQLLERWWDQLRQGGTPFPVGLKALDRMLGP